MTVTAHDHALWERLKLNDNPVRLLMGQRRPNKSVLATPVKISESVRTEIQGLAEDAVDRLKGSKAMPFSETQLLEDDEYFSKQLTLPGSADGDVEEQSLGSLLAAVDDAQRSTVRLSLDEIDSSTFPFYVITAQDDSNETLAFVKKQRSFKIGRKGKFLLRYSDGMEKLEEPVFAMAYDFDFVLYKGTLSIWNIDNYFEMFTDVGELQRAVPQFIGELAEKMPLAVSAESIANLTQAGSKGVRLAQQARRLSRSSWLSEVTEDKMRLALTDLKDVAHRMEFEGNKMTVHPEDVPTFFNVLEQRIWRGRFDDQPRRSQASKPLL